MRIFLRRFFATRRPWMLFMVPALLSITVGAIAVDPAPRPAPPVVLLNGEVVPAGRSTPIRGVGVRQAARLISVNASRRAARLPLAQATPDASVRGPGPTTQLHLIKVVHSDAGLPALETDWILEAAGERTDGPTNLSGVTPVDSPMDFKPDRYTLSEFYVGTDPQVGESYVAGPWTCVDTVTGDPVAVSETNQVVVNFGDDITCTIVNSSGGGTPTPTPTFTPTPTSTPSGPCTQFKIRGRKLYRAYEGPFGGGLVGMSGWTITATLIGAEEITLSTTTNALGEFELAMDYPGPMAFTGATIRVCEAPRAHWVALAPACAVITIPDPLPPSCTLPVPDFVNAQEYRRFVDP